MDIDPIILAAIIGAVGAIIAAVIGKIKGKTVRGIAIGIPIGIVVGFVGYIIFDNSCSSEELAGSEEIPLTAGWEAQGPGAVDIKVGDENLEFMVSLHGGDDYAELFLDLGSVRLSQSHRNENNTYDLTGAEIVAVVSSDCNFMGDLDHPNGAQIILKNEEWEAIVIGAWLDINDAMMTQAGMEIFYGIPDDEIFSDVAGICLKFTIGSGSDETYEGSFFLQSVTIVR